MKISVASQVLVPRRPFRISRPRQTELRNVFIRLEREGIFGYGEAAPSSFYGESWSQVAERLSAVAPLLADCPIESVADIENFWSAAWPVLAPSRAAQCALDLALWDWFGRRSGKSVAHLLWSRKAEKIVTFCTVGLSTPAELAEKARELHGFPRIKIKCDQSVDLHPVRFFRERSSALFAVDANCAWRHVDLRPLSRELLRLDIAFIEQPHPPECDSRLHRGASCLPLFADESCVEERDVQRVATHFEGFNIKLVKCGGLTPARRMLAAGRALGQRVMVGCMIESSLLISAGAALAQGADFADLDGAWLIGNDPFSGWKFAQGQLRPPREPGLGVTPCRNLEWSSKILT